MIIKLVFDGLCICLVAPPSQILFKSPSVSQDIWKRQGSGGQQWANRISCKITGCHVARADAHGWGELSGDSASASHCVIWVPSAMPCSVQAFGLWPQATCCCLLLWPQALGKHSLPCKWKGRMDRPRCMTGRPHKEARERNLITHCCWQVDFLSGIIFMT